MSSLIDEIRQNHFEKVREILINEPTLINKECFFEAARIGDFEIVKWLVEYSRISLNEYDDNHRNVLHYAAESGNYKLFKYLVEKCGMDPLKGDKNLCTPWDIVRNKDYYSKEIDDYLADKYEHPYEDFYRNPIRCGFFPDPSICRVGDDYYMVNSSFIFFPCIPVSHSKDLINWEIIGYAITNPEWAGIDKLEGGRGFWAPDISFYKGRFYITATYRLNDVPPVYRRQVVVSSDKPEGPYSEPAFIDEDGIDPSIFNDDDGKRYMLLNRGARIFELDETATRQISDARLLFYGDHKRAPEGPHLYKKDGYYYLLEAEGGTGPGHRVTVSRSKELFGNYEPCPYNPIMRQEDEDALIQRCGHGDLVDTPDGRWYMVYLCGRKMNDEYSILGRETAIDPVTWTADGWPVVNNLKGPSCMQIKPFPEMKKTEYNKTMVSNCGLPMDYMTPRTFKNGDISYKEDKNEKHFVIKGSKYDLSDVNSRNIVLRRQTSFSFNYSADLNISEHELKDSQKAGITGYYDENTFFEFGIIKKGPDTFVYSREHIGDDDKWQFSKKIEDKFCGISFKMETSYLTRKLYYNFLETSGKKSEIIPFNVLDNVYYLCDEGLKKGKRFTGALVGMYAFSGAFDDLLVDFSNSFYEDINVQT